MIGGQWWNQLFCLQHLCKKCDVSVRGEVSISNNFEIEPRYFRFGQSLYIIRFMGLGLRDQTYISTPGIFTE